MIEISIDAQSTEGAVEQMQGYFGGSISERFGEYVLEFDGEIGRGTIKCLTFDWGVSLVEFDAFFHKDLIFINDNSVFNPIHFSYVSKGQFQHRFNNEEEFVIVEQYHAAIIVGSKNSKHITLIPKGLHIKLNNIRVVRQEYIKKRLNNVEQLNEKLHKVFVDEKSEDTYAYYSPIHLRMEEYVNSIRDSKPSGMMKVLHIEGEVYQLLSMHIARHDRSQNSNAISHNLLKEELKVIKKLGETIVENPSMNYALEKLSFETGLSQAKLQEGFKFLYTRTVTEHIRYVRLEAARDLMNTTDLNISQIVYSIGFTSRSYFSKIFKERFGITPNEYKRQIVIPISNIL